jgi:heptosyltransferase-3
MPCIFTIVVRLLRFVGWLPKSSYRSNKIRTILVVQPYNSLGDLVLSFPLLDEIHRQWPEADIDLVVGNMMTTLFQDISYVRHVFGFTPSRKRSPLGRYLDTFHLFLLYRNTIRDNYDLALDPRWDSDLYAFLARAMLFLSGARLRVAYSGYADGIDPSLDSFVTHLAVGGSDEHESLRKLRMLQRVGLSVRVANESESSRVNASLLSLATCANPSVFSLLEKAGIKPKEQYAVLAPSASSPMRIWPIENLSQLVSQLYKQYGLRCVIVGSTGDTKFCNRLIEMNPEVSVSLVGKTDLRELLSILSQAVIFIGNDSGPAHLCGMLGLKTLVISPFPQSSNGIDHRNAPSRFRPCGPEVRVVQPELPIYPCGPACYSKSAHCIGQVSTDIVLAECEYLLRTSSTRPTEDASLRRSANAS